MKLLCGVCKIVGIFAAVGALNWGFIGLFHVDLVGKIFGEMSLVSRLIYIVVGISGALLLVSFFRVCPKCKQMCQK